MSECKIVFNHGLTQRKGSYRLMGKVCAVLFVFTRRGFMKEVPIWEKANLTIREAAEYSNIGINRLEELLKKPNCSFVLYVGKKKLVKRREFEKLLSDTVEIS